MLEFIEYQEAAERTAIYPERKKFRGLEYAVLGLAGEAGEVAQKLKKLMRDQLKEIPAEGPFSLNENLLTPNFRIQLADELGDVLWYIAAIASEINYPLEQIARRNMEKLNARKVAGTLGGSGDQR